MNNVMIALGIFILAALLLLVFISMLRKSPAVFRNIEAYQRLNRAVGRAVEERPAPASRGPLP